MKNNRSFDKNTPKEEFVDIHKESRKWEKDKRRNKLEYGKKSKKGNRNERDHYN